VSKVKVKAVIYARVSTDRQNYAGQLATLKEWAVHRGFEVVSPVYAESESAWKDGHQAELSRLLADAGRRKFDIVLVWALDRLCRGGSLAILTLVDRLHRSGVKVLSYQEAWTEAPGEMSELLFALVGWVARMESTRKSERVKLALSRPGTREKVGKRGPDKRKRKRRGVK
jgi:DNA invertase Pin-like site-specific DNA recombinase